jgi:hypothetical protein
MALHNVELKQEKARGAPVIDRLPEPLLEVDEPSSRFQRRQEMIGILGIVFLANGGCAENVINIRGAKNSGLKHFGV